MSQLRDLSRKINALLTAPYAVSLTPLQQQVDPGLLRDWSEVKSCQITPLAAVVIADLPKDISSLRILAAFATLPKFRDAVLLQRPDILPAVLQLAIDEDHFTEIAFETCIALFSSPLPANVAMPTMVPKLLEKVLEAIIHMSCGKSISILLRSIECFSVKVLETVPEGLLCQLIDEFKTILKRTDAHLDNLNCMTIMGRVFETYLSDTAISSSGSTTLSPSVFSAWASRMQSFFRPGSKATANITQTVLRVAFYCKTGTGTEGAEAINSANKILDIVESEVLTEWARGNPDIIQKLLEKVVLPGLDSNVRFAVFAIVMKLDPQGLHCDCSDSLTRLAAVFREENSPQTLQAILDVDIVTKFYSGIELYLNPVSQAYAPATCKILVKEMLRFIHEQCRPGQSPSTSQASKLGNAILLVSALQASSEIMAAPALPDVFVDMASEVGVPEWWALNLSEPDNFANCGRLDLCPQTLERRRLELRRRVSSFLIKIAAIGDKNLNRKDFQLLSDQIVHAMTLETKFCCIYGVSADLPKPIFSLTASDKYLPGARLNWQMTLDEQLNQNEEATRRLIVAHVNDVCRDLQHRCDNVEGPLRTMTKKMDGLQTDFEAANLGLQDARKEVQGLRSEIDQIYKPKLADLEEEGSRLYHQLTAARHDNDSLNAQFSKAQNEREACKNAATLKYEEMEMDCQVKLMKLTEEIIVSSKQVTRLEVDTLWLNEQVQLMRREQQAEHEADMVRLREAYSNEVNMVIAERTGLREVLEAAENQLDDHKVAAEARTEELNKKITIINEFTKAETAWKNEKRKLEKALQVANEKLERIQAAFGH